MTQIHQIDFSNWNNVTQCGSPSEIFKAIVDNSKILGFDFLYYETTNIPNLTFIGDPNSNAREWTRHYKTIITEIDTHSQRRRPLCPLIWGLARRHQLENDRLLRHARVLGIEAAVTVPIYFGATITSIFTFEARELKSDANLPADIIEIFVPMLHFSQHCLQIIHQKETETKRKLTLTNREIECLRWVAAGKSSWETGQILRCTERTVNFHINNAMRKLNVSKRPMAVAAALGLGVLEMHS